MQSNLKQLELFFKGSYFFRGLMVTFAIVAPLLVSYNFGWIDAAISIVLGVFINAPSDIPGSLRRKVNGIFISILLTTVFTIFILLVKPVFIFLLLVITLVAFVSSLLSVYGFRASLVSFSCLLTIVLALSVQKNSLEEILLHALLMALGGIWYLGITLFFNLVVPRKDEDQLLSDTLRLTGEYLKIRAKLLIKVEKRKRLQKKALVLQTEINEKHETLREVLLKERKRSGRSHLDEKRLLIFMSSVEIFELALANTLDYSKIDRQFGDQKHHINAFRKVNKVFGNHLIKLSELIISKDKIPSKKVLVNTLLKANEAIDLYVEEVQLPKARFGAITLRNLYDYQRQLLQEIRAVRRAMANVNKAFKITSKETETSKFITLNEYKPTIILQHLSLKSPIFRHTLRMTISILVGFLLGTILDVKNPYWIVLTLIVIMRPNYGLTKERSVNRVVGTVIGAIVATGIILLTDNIYIYITIAIVSLTFAFALFQQSYRFAAAFITVNIIFVYALIEPNTFAIIKFRIIDTAIGVIIAVIANYTLWPSWETMSLEKFFLQVVRTNKEYLLATKNLCYNKEKALLEYKMSRKQAFLTMADLNAAFQRLTQEPKSKQKEMELIYTIVTLNHTILSSIASIGNFVVHHHTTKPSEEFDIYVNNISHILDTTVTIIDSDDTVVPTTIDMKAFRKAQKKLLNTYRELSSDRDKDIQEGHMKIDDDMLVHLQEAHLISNQLFWIRNLSKKLKKSVRKYHEIFAESSY